MITTLLATTGAVADDTAFCDSTGTNELPSCDVMNTPKVTGCKSFLVCVHLQVLTELF